MGKKEKKRESPRGCCGRVLPYIGQVGYHEMSTIMKP